MATLSTSDWRTFLKARILQEEGKDAEALTVFDQLLATYPDDAHLNSSCAFALERLGRSGEAVAGRIAVKYTELGKRLSGPADKPADWTNELSSLVGSIQDFDARGAAPAVLLAW